MKTETETEIVTVKKSDLESLIEDSLELQELQCAGVDNWGGCDETEEVTESDIEFTLKKLVLKKH